MPIAGATLAVAAIAAAVGFGLAWLLRQTQCARLEERLNAERARNDDARLAEMRAIAEGLKHQVLQASDELASRQSSEFLVRATERLGVTLDPVGKRLADLDALIHRFEEARAKGQGEMAGQIASLGEQARSWSRNALELGSQTSALASALRNPRMQGEWGEMQLRRVVELAGMTRFADFAEQQTVQSEDGRSRPDLTVALPGGQRVFVDAKAPIGGMIEIAAADDEATRNVRMLAHANAVRAAADGLARKRYQDADKSLDFVIMFVPGEGALAAACTALPTLIEDALAKGVVLASPLSLILMLRAFAVGWQQVDQNDNAREISKLGRELYESLAVFGNHFSELGVNLKRATGAFNDAVACYERRILVRGRRIKERASLAHDGLKDIAPVDVIQREVPIFNDPQTSLLPDLESDC